MSKKPGPSATQLLDIINALGHGLVCINSSLRVTLANTAISRLLNMPSEQLQGIKLLSLFPDNRDFLLHILQLDPKSLPITDITIEFRSRTFSLSLFSGTSIDPCFKTILLIREITQSILEAKQIRDQEKATFLANLTAGMAHEMNNPLSGIGGFADLLLRKKKRFNISGEALEIIESIKENASRAATILNDLLIFSHTQKDYVRLLDMHQMISKLVRTLHCPETISMRMELQAEQIQLRSDPERLKRALANVLHNAINAVAMRLENQPEPLGLVVIKTMDEPDYLVVEVTDNGIGIPVEYIKYIFDPFFAGGNIKPITGIGFYTTKNIITSMGGAIDVTSISNRTSVRIRLPHKTQEAV